jgi:hypothetical protein
MYQKLTPITTSSTKAKFRSLQKDTFTAYRSIATQTVVMMVRYMLWMNHGRIKHLGKFKPMVTAVQSSIVGNIYSIFLSETGDNGDGTHTPSLEVLIHRLLVTILTTKAFITTKVGLPVEQVILLNMLHQNGSYKRTNLLTQLCARTQRLTYSIFIHSGFLGSFNCDYTIPPSELLVNEDEEVGIDADELGNSDSDEEEEALEEFEESISEAEFGIPGQGAAEDTEIQEFIEGNVPTMPLQLLSSCHPDDSYDPLPQENIVLSVTHLEDGEVDKILRCASGLLLRLSKLSYVFNSFFSDEENRQYVLPMASTESTLSSRIKAIWLTARPIAELEPSAVRLDWQAGGQAFRFKFSQMDKVITLSNLRSAVVGEVMRLDEALHDLLPPTFDISTFSLDLIHDSPDDQGSLFDRTDNKEIFGRFVTDLWLKLGRHGKKQGREKDAVVSADGILQKKPAEQFLQKCEIFQGCMMRTFFFTVGICPRPWQAGHFLYRPVGNYPRNLRMVDDTFVVIGSPKAKQTDTLTADAFWALPPQLGLAIMFYLGVIRPVEINLMERLNIPTNEAHNFIFIHTAKRLNHTQQHWDGTAVNKSLTGGKDPLLCMEGRAWRHITSSLVDYHFSPLLQSSLVPKLKSLADAAVLNQAQHTRSVAETHYGVDAMTRGIGMTKTSRIRQFAISQTYQAFLGLVPQNYEWSQYSTSDIRPDADRDRNRIVALGTARCLILQGEYDVASGNRQERIQKVENILALKPFITGNWVSGITGICDLSYMWLLPYSMPKSLGPI